MKLLPAVVAAVLGVAVVSCSSEDKKERKKVASNETDDENDNKNLQEGDGSSESSSSGGKTSGKLPGGGPDLGQGGGIENPPSKEDLDNIANQPITNSSTIEFLADVPSVVSYNYGARYNGMSDMYYWYLQDGKMVETPSAGSSSCYVEASSEYAVEDGSGPDLNGVNAMPKGTKINATFTMKAGEFSVEGNAVQVVCTTISTNPYIMLESIEKALGDKVKIALPSPGDAKIKFRSEVPFINSVNKDWFFVQSGSFKSELDTTGGSPFNFCQIMDTSDHYEGVSASDLESIVEVEDGTIIDTKVTTSSDWVAFKGDHFYMVCPVSDQYPIDSILGDVIDIDTAADLF